ncbi:hypothetical protein [Roseomonas populi]|uniref:DUF4393 domain-containing protein n=1 Tax=Roseomonas populi TaxID=3121582 RepID=A0ABT1X124_9PROT|nr:hypothetical protein [Roseomonas pecuniae]MCR0981803.1 hypothetical protein [Roseomonas pecuniae]
MNKSPGTSLSRSIGSDSLKDVLATSGDIGLNAAVDSGALDGVPVLNVLTGLYKAQRDVRQVLYQRKIARFLKGLDSTSAAEREKFTNDLEKSGKLEEFGETILELIDKSDEVRKPRIVGRIMAAHISGSISYEQAIRVSTMINRVFLDDLNFLANFVWGFPSDFDREIAASLAAAGFLRSDGTDLGGIGGSLSSSKIRYRRTRYGDIVVEYGLEWQS